MTIFRSLGKNILVIVFLNNPKVISLTPQFRLCQHLGYNLNKKYRIKKILNISKKVLYFCYKWHHVLKIPFFMIDLTKPLIVTNPQMRSFLILSVQTEGISAPQFTCPLSGMDAPWSVCSPDVIPQVHLKGYGADESVFINFKFRSWWGF